MHQHKTPRSAQQPPSNPGARQTSEFPTPQGNPVSVQIGEAAYFGSYEIEAGVLAVTYGQRRKAKALDRGTLATPFVEARRILRELVTRP